jgi:sugar lactone lactonase YvrE
VIFWPEKGQVDRFWLQFRPYRFGIEAMHFPGRHAACILFLLIGIGQLRGQNFTFTTLVGGTSGTNDGVNSAAQFDFPGGIAVDNQGNLFVGDTSNNTIRKVAPVGDDWVVTTIAGVPGFGAIGNTNDGPMPIGRLYRPDGVVADTNGNLFVVDHNNDTIRQLIFNGSDWFMTTIAGLGGARDYVDGTNSDARFWGPTGIAMDGAGNLYVGDTATFTVRKIAHIGTNWVTTTIAGLGLNPGFADGTNSDAQFSSPFGLAVDPNTNIFVADFGNHAIRKIRPVGTNWVTTTIAGNGDIGHADGTNLQAQFNFPADITIDKDGNLYVSDQSNNTIRKITPVGTNWVVTTIGGVATVQGTNNGLGTNALFFRPWGIATDGQGRLFIVDHSNNTIREGIPASSAAPTLRIARTGANVLLSWPLAASKFVLELSITPSSGASWTPMTNGIVISGNYFWLTNNANDSQAFYRLHGSGP